MLSPSLAKACPDGSSMSYVFLADPVEAVPHGAVLLRVRNIQDASPLRSEFSRYFAADIQQVMLGSLAQKSVRISLAPPSGCGPFATVTDPSGSPLYPDPAYVVGYLMRYSIFEDYDLFPLGYRSKMDRAAGEIATQNIDYESRYADSYWEPFPYGLHIVGGCIVFGLGVLFFRMRRSNRSPMATN